ncbi:hypothetical protein JYT28_00865 [Desulfobulbus sp. AH-315-M07]|nr:hypothetical protein [Desulfobulbus sp. AH-315-M07]
MTTVERKQEVRIETQEPRHFFGAIAGGAAFFAVGIGLGMGLSPKEGSKTAAIGYGAVFGTGSVVMLSLWLGSLAKSGKTETRGRVTEKTSARVEFCHGRPEADLALALRLRAAQKPPELEGQGDSAYSATDRIVRFGKTNAQGVVKANLLALLREAFPGWPEFEPELSPIASVVVADSPAEVVGDLDLKRFQALKFAQHAEFAVAARQRRDAERAKEQQRKREEEEQQREREEEEKRRQRDAAARRARECRAKCASSCRGQPACVSQCVASRCK